MSTFDDPALLDALSAPLGDLITAVGTSVAEAQQALDKASLASLTELYESEHHAMLQAIGYRPTWYQIPEVDAEIAMALSVTGSTEERGSNGRVALYGAPVDAGYTRRFGFELQGASRVRFKVVPVPPSTTAEAMQAVPPLVGRTLRQALGLLRTLNLDYERPDPADLEALVTHQTPGPGAILEPDERVVLELALAPDVRGLTVQEARSLLAAEGIDLVVDADAHDHSLIVGQDPGPAGAMNGGVVTVEVLRSPDLVGLSGADARALVEQLGLTVGVAVADEARVTRQQPAPGLLLDAGVTVDAWSEMPDLLGSSIAAARDLLARFGALAATPPGTPETAVVAGQTPAVGTEVPLSVVVQLQPAVVPDLLGRTRTEADSDAAVAGLHLDAPADMGADALVARQSPAAGGLAESGMSITVEPTEIPDVRGLSSEDASRTLDALGVAFRLPTDAHPAVRVSAQRPAAGSYVTGNTEVELTLPEVPDLSGMSPLVVAATLQALGMPYRSNPPTKNGRVIGQSPDPGEPLTRTDRALTVEFG